MWKLWSKEPTLILAVVSAGLALGMGFGLHVTPQQMGLIMAFAAAVLGLINRGQVTSPDSLQALTSATLQAAQDASQPVKDTVRKLPVVLLVALLAGGLSACASAPPSLSPAGVSAFNNTRVIKGLDLLRDTARDAAAQHPPLITFATRQKVITFHQSALRVIAATSTPANWKAPVLAGLDEVLKDLPDKERTLLTTYVALAKTIIHEVAP